MKINNLRSDNMKYTIVGIYELSIEANSLEEAMTKMQDLKLKECKTYVSDYDYEE